MKAFMDLIPMKKEEPLKEQSGTQKHVFDYLQKEEKQPELVTINLSKKYVHSMSED